TRSVSRTPRLPAARDRRSSAPEVYRGSRKRAVPLAAGSRSPDRHSCLFREPNIRIPRKAPAVFRLEPPGELLLVGCRGWLAVTFEEFDRKRWNVLWHQTIERLHGVAVPPRFI